MILSHPPLYQLSATEGYEHFPEKVLKLRKNTNIIFHIQCNPSAFSFSDIALPPILKSSRSSDFRFYHRKNKFIGGNHKLNDYVGASCASLPYRKRCINIFLRSTRIPYATIAFCQASQNPVYMADTPRLVPYSHSGQPVLLRRQVAE